MVDAVNIKREDAPILWAIDNLNACERGPGCYVDLAMIAIEACRVGPESFDFDVEGLRDLVRRDLVRCTSKTYPDEDGWPTVVHEYELIGEGRCVRDHWLGCACCGAVVAAEGEAFYLGAPEDAPELYARWGDAILCPDCIESGRAMEREVRYPAVLDEEG